MIYEGKKIEQEGLIVEAYFWSCPDMKHWQRLILFWIYIPIIVYYYIIGAPLLLARWEPIDKERQRYYLDYRRKKE